jgi:hemolysin III
MAISKAHQEEIANAVTHGVAAVASIIGTVSLLIHGYESGSNRLFYSCLVYGIGIIFLFSASTLYHSFQSERVKNFFRILDHCGIYLMIAGTYTPFMSVTLEGIYGDVILFLIWLIAIAGIIFKIFFTGKFETFSVILYLVMGWIVILVIKPMFDNLSFWGMMLVAAGGVFFSIGVIFYRWEKLAFSHAFWHLFVVAGGVCHYFAVYFHALPAPIRGL